MRAHRFSFSTLWLVTLAVASVPSSGCFGASSGKEVIKPSNAKPLPTPTRRSTSAEDKAQIERSKDLTRERSELSNPLRPREIVTVESVPRSASALAKGTGGGISYFAGGSSTKPSVDRSVPLTTAQIEHLSTVKTAVTESVPDNRPLLVPDAGPGTDTVVEGTSNEQKIASTVTDDASSTATRADNYSTSNLPTTTLEKISSDIVGQGVKESLAADKAITPEINPLSSSGTLKN